MSYILFLEVVLRGGILALAETADPDLDAQVYITLLSKLRIGCLCFVHTI